MTIFDRTMQLLERSLDLRGARQQVIAANIANEETPKYRATQFELPGRRWRTPSRASSRSPWSRHITTTSARRGTAFNG